MVQLLQNFPRRCGLLQG